MFLFGNVVHLPKRVNTSVPSIIRNIKDPISPIKDISGAFFEGIGTQTQDLDFQYLRVTLLTTQHISPFLIWLPIR